MDTEHAARCAKSAVLFAKNEPLCGVRRVFEVAEWRPREQNNELIFRMIAYVEEHYSEI